MNLEIEQNDKRKFEVCKCECIRLTLDDGRESLKNEREEKFISTFLRCLNIPVLLICDRSTLTSNEVNALLNFGSRNASLMCSKMNSCASSDGSRTCTELTTNSLNWSINGRIGMRIGQFFKLL
jgi:K+-transporting ATPase A subunit